MLFEERAIYVEGMFCGATCVTEEDEPCQRNAHKEPFEVFRDRNLQ